MTVPDPISTDRIKAQAEARNRLAALIAGSMDPEFRVRRLKIEGRTYWLKRPEQPKSLRWRLQKGNPRRAFDSDLAGLRFLAERRVPAPALVHVDADWFVTGDAGRPLDELLRTSTDSEGAALAAAAARTLAKLHHAGARHGRPKLRDICWDGRTARLIDLERFRENASARAMGLDWVILLHSLLETMPAGGTAFASAVKTMRAEAPPPVTTAATLLVRRLSRVAPLLRGAERIWPKNREIAAASRLPHAFAAT
jgi:tRNA A-37 threonylcarbamoyl transferase component Bud32